MKKTSSPARPEELGSKLVKRLGIVKIRPTRVTQAESLGEKFYDTNGWFAKPVFTLDLEYGTIWAHTPRAYEVIQELLVECRCQCLLLTENYA